MTTPSGGGGGGNVIGRAIIRIIPAVENFAKELRKQLHQATGSLRQLDREIAPVRRSMMWLARNATGIAPGIRLATMAFRALAAEAIVGGIIALGGALYEAAGALAVLPAVGFAAASAMAALSVGMRGIQDALKKFDDAEKFNEAIEGLSKNARAAMNVFNEFRPRIEAFRNAVQDSLFAGIDQTLRNLGNTLLPLVQRHFVQLTGTFNRAAKQLAAFVQQASTLRDLRNITANVSTAFERLRPAIQPASQAILDLVAVGSNFLPMIADELVAIVQQISNFVQAARQSGQLAGWIQGGIAALKQMGQIIFNVGHALRSVLITARTAGMGLLDTLENASAQLRDFFASAEGRNALIHFLEQARSAAQTLLPIIGALADVFFNHLLPVLTNFGMTIGPAVTQFIRALGQAIDLAAPGIALFAQGFASFITAIIPALPALGQLVGAIGGLVGALSAALGPAIADVVVSIANMLIPIINALSAVISVLPGAFFKFITVLGVVIVTIAGVISALRGMIAFATIFATGLAGMATAASFLTGILGKLTTFIKTPLGMAIIGIVSLLGTFAFSSDDAAVSQENLSMAAKDLNQAIRDQNGIIDENIRKKAAQQLDENGALEMAQNLGLSTQQVTEAYLHQGEALEDLQEKLQANIKLYQSQVQANRDAQDSGAGVTRFPDAEKNLTDSQRLLATLNQLTGARNADTAAMERQASATGQLTGVIGLANTMLEFQRQALSAVAELQRQDTEAKLAAINANLGYHNQLAATKAELADGAKTLDIHTQEGRDNIAAITQLVDRGNARIQQMRTEGATNTQLNKVIAQQEKDLLDLITPLFRNREAARQWATQLGLIPRRVNTEATMNTKQANSALSTIIARINSIPKSKRTDYYFYTHYRTQGASRPEHLAPTWQGVGGLARGGPIRSGEWSWVGEEGPELVRFGQAARVFSNNESMDMMRGTDSMERFTGPPGAAQARGAGGATQVTVASQPEVHVYVDGRELRSVAVDVLDQRDRQLSRVLRSGSRSRA